MYNVFLFANGLIQKRLEFADIDTALEFASRPQWCRTQVNDENHEYIASYVHGKLNVFDVEYREIAERYEKVRVS